jgi:mannitol-specific phosphotransferase system IIBC component
VLRYTVLRLLIFFGCLIFFWLVGLRNNEILLLAVSAVVSVALSYFLLRSQRNRFSEQIADRIERRQATRQRAAGTAGTDGTDEAAEDAELDAGLDADHRDR